MHNVLFVESGTAGGGSFESLYQHLRVIDRQRFRPSVVYLNENRYVDRVLDLRIPVHILTDLLYSKHAFPLLRPAILKAAKWADRYFDAFYVDFRRMVHTPLIRRLERVIREEKADIIHLNVQTNRDLFGIMVAERTGVPCISHLRSRYSGGFGQRRAAYTNRIVSAYVANSKEYKDYWEQKGLDAQKMWLVLNGIPLQQIASIDLRRSLSISDQVRFVVGCVAPLRNTLKVDTYLLKAFAHFQSAYPDTVLVIVGDGKMKEYLIRQSRVLNIHDRVIFTGFQENAKELLASFDVSVVPSGFDSFGRVVLETMLARTPLVATDVGGIREAVQHEHNGLLIEYGDEEGFTEAMQRLLTDENLRERLVENGYRTIEERFSIERYAADIERVYESVLNG